MKQEVSIHSDELEAIRQRIAKATRELQSAQNDWIALCVDTPFKKPDKLEPMPAPRVEEPVNNPLAPRRPGHPVGVVSKKGKWFEMRAAIVKFLELATEPTSKAVIAAELQMVYSSLTGAIEGDPQFIKINKKIWLRSREKELKGEAPVTLRVNFNERAKVQSFTPKPDTWPTVVTETLAVEQPLTLQELAKITKIPTSNLWSLLQNTERFEKDGQLYWLAGEARSSGMSEPETLRLNASRPLVRSRNDAHLMGG